MASDAEETPQTPSTSRVPKRRSIIGYFGGLSMNEAEEHELFNQETPSEEKGKMRLDSPDPSRKQSVTSTSPTISPEAKRSLLRGTFRGHWPPTIRGRHAADKGSTPTKTARTSKLTLRMSDLYRTYGDNWAMNPKVEDNPTDVSAQFVVVGEIIDEIKTLLDNVQKGEDYIADALLREMAQAVYTSNLKARKGMGLDNTLTLCMMIFNGNQGVEYTDRTEEYQARLERLVKSSSTKQEVIRSRREVVQHAAAFQHMVNAFVPERNDMTEKLIKDTHEILMKGISGEAAGVLSRQEFGGIYRKHDVYVGTTRFPRPRKIPKAMKAMISKLQAHLKDAEQAGELDPFATAAEYCDLFVNIHPFRDGNGRMCRLILNAILIKYARIVVNIGEQGQSRDEYIQTARESREVGGHSGALASMVLNEATKSYRKIRNTLRSTILHTSTSPGKASTSGT